MSNARVNEAQAEVERLRAEVERLRTDVKGSREWAEAEAAEVERLRAESESRRQDLLLQTDATNHFKAEAYKALDEVKRLKGDGVCYGDFVGECYRVGRVPCSECEKLHTK